MANVNVNRNVTDVFYRYKMPKLLAKVEGKGNGIKTVIVNMPEIAKALSRPPTYPTKFFGCELGAQTQFDLKNERFIVNGSHDSEKLQDLLDGFIRKFVLCPECDNPETNLAVSAKKGMIGQRCMACGHQGNVDMTHKLTTFILKNPPKQDPSATPGKKDRKNKKKGKDNDEEPGSPEAEEVNDQSNGQDRRNEDDWDDEYDWGEDTSEAAVKKRMQDLTDAAKNLAVSSDLEKTQQERLDMFYEYVKSKRENNVLAKADKDVATEAERLDVKDKGPLILVELLFTDKILAEIKTYRKLFLRFTHENPKAQKYLLGGMEQLIGNIHKDTLMPKVAHILKACYDNDILDEEVILEWDKKVSKKYVSKEIAKDIHSKAQPFIEWLKNAEEEEESSEEEVEVVYTSKAKSDTIEKVSTESSKPAANSTATPAKVEEEDDIDIDAI